MSEQLRDVARAFLYGFTGIGLFRRLRPLGVPMKFVDNRPESEAIISGDYFTPTVEFPPHLFPFEMAILTCIAQRKGYREIAFEFGDSEALIKRCVRRIYDKLRASDRLELGLNIQHDEIILSKADEENTPAQEKSSA